MADPSKQVSIEIDGLVFTAQAGMTQRPVAEIVWSAIHGLCKKAGQPVSINRAGWAGRLGVCEKTVSNAISRLKADHRLEQSRSGRQYWYSTIDGPQQMELVTVAAITPWPSPITRMDQLGGTWMAPGEPALQSGQCTEQEEGRLPEPAGNVAGTLPESAGNTAGKLPESARNMGGKLPESAGNVGGRLPESGEQVASKWRESYRQPVVVSPPGVQPPNEPEASSDELLRCPQCGPGTMQPTVWNELSWVALPGKVYFCSGNSARCSRLVHTVIGEFRAAGLEELADPAASELLRKALGKPRPAPQARRPRAQPPVDPATSRTGYADDIRKFYGGHLPWEPEFRGGEKQLEPDEGA